MNRKTLLMAFGVCGLCAHQLMAVQTTSAQSMAHPQATAQAAGVKHEPMGQGDIVMKAKADIKGEGISGTAQFVEYKAPNTDSLDKAAWKGALVQVTVHVMGLKPGLHGMHLHAVGTCSPDFAAAGGHFDPGPAGNMDPDANHPYHMGDLPNLFVNAEGHGTASAMTSRVTLSDGPLSVFDTDGTAIIIHASPDKGITGEPKSGVGGGARLACGVLQKQ